MRIGLVTDLHWLIITIFHYVLCHCTWNIDSKIIKPIYLESLNYTGYYGITLYRLPYEILKLYISADVKMPVFCRKVMLLCRLKTLILLKFMTLQLFARYSMLATYVSAAPIPSDIIVYAFLSGSLGSCSLYFSMYYHIMEPFLWVPGAANMSYIDVLVFYQYIQHKIEYTTVDLMITTQLIPVDPYDLFHLCTCSRSQLLKYNCCIETQNLNSENELPV